MTRAAQNKGMGKDTGKWSVDICLMPDLGEERGAPKTDPSSILCQDPGLGAQCRKSDQVLSTIGPSSGDHKSWKAQNIP